MNRHVIYRQKITLKLVKEEQAHAIQSEISDILKNELPQLLERLFDDLSNVNEIIRIDSLNIDLGTLPVKQLRQNFKEELISQLRNAITKKIQNPTGANDSAIIYKEQSLQQAFTHFMRYGIKPWFFATKTMAEWETDLLTQFTKQQWQSLVVWLQHNFKHNPVIIERLVSQFSDNILHALVQESSIYGQGEWLPIYNDLLSFYKMVSPTKPANARNELWIRCFTEFLDDKHQPDAIYIIIKTCLQSIPGNIPVFLKQNREIIEGALQAPVFGNIINRLIDAYERDESNTANRRQNLLNSSINEKSSKQKSRKNEASDGENTLNKNDGTIDKDLQRTNVHHDNNSNSNNNIVNKDALKDDNSSNDNKNIPDQGALKHNDSSNDKKNISNQDALKDNDSNNDNKNIPDQDAPKDNDSSNDNKNIPNQGALKDYGSRNDNKNIPDQDALKDNDSSNDNKNVPNQDALKDNYDSNGNNNISNKDDLKNSDARDNDIPVNTIAKKTPAINKITEAQYVTNSGVVILHPFFLMYFEELELLQDKEFINDDAAKHATLLLHYLATGKTEIPEFDVLLQKILCGLSVEKTLANKLEITEKEIEESERLLKSVINYWPPLKNTSIEGLRNTFLQREGKLEPKENGWLLTVEQKTVDILLDKLPWGFSTIRLPWMKETLSIDWC